MSIQEQNTTRLSNQNTLHNSPKKAPDSTPQHDAKMRRRLFAARAGFFTGGFTVASWAPIIPFVQTELSLEPAVLGTLLFGLGIGSFFGMPIAGTVSTRFGNRAALAASGVLSCLLLVVLAMIPGFRIECAALLLYGVTLGCLEVSANIYGAQLEKEAGHPLMSGLHAAYSVGEVVSAGAITGLLVLGVPLLWVVGGLMVVLAAVLLWALSGVSPAEGRSAAKSEGMVFAPARGRILMLSLVCMSVFLAEGAMLDWSAIYVHQVGGVDLKAAGVGYTLFVIAMAIARLMGDRMVERFGRARVLVTGMLLMFLANYGVRTYQVSDVTEELRKPLRDGAGHRQHRARAHLRRLVRQGMRSHGRDHDRHDDRLRRPDGRPRSARLHRPAQVARDRVSLHRRAAHNGASQRNPREQAAHREILNRRQA